MSENVIIIIIIIQLVTRHMSIKSYQIWRNWIAGADEEGYKRRNDAVYKYVLSCFLKESNDKEKSVRWTGRAFHIEGAAWQKARLAKTVLATSTWRRILELERRDLDVVWKLSRSARYSGLFFVNVLNVWRAILNLIREATGSQCRSPRTGVMWSRFLVPDTTRVPVCWWLSATCWGWRPMCRTVLSCSSQFVLQPLSRQLFGQFQHRRTSVGGVEGWFGSGRLCTHCQRDDRIRASSRVMPRLLTVLDTAIGASPRVTASIAPSCRFLAPVRYADRTQQVAALGRS